ncbi:hypothetical protein QBC38DRAFT_113184 [Podospora fimiseda]|uniref:C2H2-type domain-containing protein n=1 Tax=Podospora fimiseda TaxID=252190 RepID=A0AAN6YNK0_9PEZI|nr:hypothetical protein QBC38DRAFT_113184 [Podospora fimiseda]
MPFDPEWEVEGTGEYQTFPGSDPPNGKGLLHDQDFEKVIWDLQDDDDGLGYEGGDDMEIDLQVLPKPSQRQELDPPPQRPQPLVVQNSIPKATTKLPSLRPTPRSAQIAVVLNSSPHRAPFTTLRDDEYSDDPLSMITSDLIPKPQPKRTVQVLPPKPSLVAPAEASTAEPQKKKRGRPFGWRPGSGPYTNLTSGDSPAAPRPKPPPKKPVGEKRKVGRTGRPPAPTGRQTYLAQNPHFLVFKCEWQGCKAELHNAETLRRHLLFVHGRPESSDSDEESSTTSSSSRSSSPEPRAERPSGIICKWAKCRSSATDPPITFDVSSFPEHAEEAHVMPHLWLLGDGPQNTSDSATPVAPLTDKELPSYLFDENGTVQVTPDVRDQQTENEEDRKKRQTKVDLILQQRDDNAPPEPEYTEEQLEDIAKFMAQKRKRQKMFRDYEEQQVIAESLKSAATGPAKKMRLEL